MTSRHCSFLPHGRLLSYADDTQLLDYSPPDTHGLSSLKLRVEESMHHLQNWFRSNSLKMNPDKTNFTLIGTQNSLKKAENFRITISGSTISPSPTVKVLGVVIDQQLNWDSHISMVVRRCNAITASLFKIRHHLTPEVLQLLIQTHVFPHVLYCLSVWGGAAQCRLARIQKSINFAARLVTGVRRSERISPALASLEWSRVDAMITRHDCVQVFKAFNNQECPDAVRAMFTRRAEVSARVTRASDNGDLHLTRPNLTLTQRSFSYRAAVAWNALPPAVRNEKTRRTFLSALN